MAFCGMAAKSKQLPRWSEETLRAFPRQKRYLIGVSGGRDSVALLHWLLECGYRKLIVCHLDHQLRGRSARADAKFVARLAERSGLSMELGVTDVQALAKQTKQSTETAARAARYAFFAAVARRRRCRMIFLGHHADDLVETFLINLFRGSGLQGQRSIREISTRMIGPTELTIVRPLLDVWRSEIDDYVEANRLPFREDASNRDAEPLRNRLRHRLIPLLERELGRNIRKTIFRTARIAAEEDALLAEMLPETRTELVVKRISQMPVALQRRAVARWLRAHAIADIGFDVVERVRSLLDVSAGPAKVNLSEDRHARRRAGVLFIES
jgi:tRNA(Ile)-lysidine synthase